MMLPLAAFDYELPSELIAQYPCKHREQSRLLIYHKQTKSIEHARFLRLLDYLHSGDVLVLNDTKVLPVRLYGYSKTKKRKIEAFLLGQVGKRQFRALLRPLKKLQKDEEVVVEGDHGLTFRLRDVPHRIIEFNRANVVRQLRRFGHVPLPPYIKRADKQSDRTRYQTVYAKREGAVAAPTAGLHFSRTLLTKIRQKGVHVVFVTLHVGHGTFASIRHDNVNDHTMEQEYFELPKQTIEVVRAALRDSRRVVAVGTTVSRTLEANAAYLLNQQQPAETRRGFTDLFIYPPFSFKIISALVTNFHLPKSTLYMLVASFVGAQRLHTMYEEAIAQRYRFYSYGDAMAIFPQ